MSALSRAETMMEVALKNILVATDFSPTSERAAGYARSLAERHGSRVLLAYVLPPEPYMPVPAEPTPVERQVELAEAEERMSEFVQHTCLHALEHHAILRKGPLDVAILDLLERYRVDLLVLGTRGRGGLRKLLLGSAAETLLRVATCPVLTVGPAVGKPAAGGFHAVLFATDLSPASQRALPYAVTVAAQNHARLMLLHVLPETNRARMVGELQAGVWWRRLAEMVPKEAESMVEAQPLVEFGEPSKAILKVAEGRGADLIVMGAHRTASPRVSSHFPVGTDHHVVTHARCPVLTLRS